MEFNLDKCEVINIINKRLYVYYDYNIYGKILVYVIYVKYLGLIFSINMIWNKYIDIIIKKVNFICVFL